jgi:glycosyltransferase involved in cell wall biosynthesis
MSDTSILNRPLTSSMAHSLSVVVPMFNEEELAADLVFAVQDALQNYAFSWELIVVDDGSSDSTWVHLNHAAKQVGAHVRLIRLLRNFKQTAAMQAGIDAARGDVIVTMDGDLQNDPKDIPALVEKLLAEDLDMVAGWRQKRQDGFWLRKLPSKIANRLIRNVSGLHFQDLGCSLKAFRASVLRQVRLYGEMHRFIPAWLATVTSPQRMAEVPVSHFPRTKGLSKYGLSRTFRVLLDLLSIHYFLRFGSRPGHFFGGLLKFLGESIGNRPLMFLGFFAVVSGLQLLTTGVIAEILMRTYYDAGKFNSYHTLHTSNLKTNEGWHVVN